MMESLQENIEVMVDLAQRMLDELTEMAQAIKDNIA